MNYLDSAALSLDHRNAAATLPDFVMSADGRFLSCGDVTTELLPAGFNSLPKDQFFDIVNAAMGRLTIKALTRLQVAA